MGIIVRQSIKGTVWSYVGVVLGFITTGYLFPNYLTTDTVGLFGLLMAWSALLAQLSSLGFPGITARLFPWFRDKKKNHNGFLFIAFAVMAAGFLLFLVSYYIFSPWLIDNNLEKSALFSQYMYLLIPITFFTLLYLILDSYNRLLYDTVFGTFLTEFLQRFIILAIVLLFVVRVISLHHLVLLYSGAVCVKGAIMFFYLLIKGEMNLNPQPKFISKKLRNEMINVGFYSILTGLGSSVVFSIDKIIVNQMLGLDYTGIYNIAFYFGTLVIIPSRPLLRIAGTLISDAWKNNEVSHIADIYHKSCLNQFIIAAFLFGGIWINIDNILTILGPSYMDGKWVIFFIGLGYLIDMATGANALIIAYSQYYRMSLWFLLILVALVVSTMYFLIPLWGITGAAIAIFLSFLVNNILRYIFLYYKFSMQPFTRHFLLVIISFIPAWFLSKLLPQMPLVWDILIRSSIFSVVYGGMIVGLKASVVVNYTLFNIIKYLQKMVRKS